ncbi:MAG: barstar family protein [Flavobacteriales bacterium]|nr:barstar family protein [Flavobacteriales bacterium]
MKEHIIHLKGKKLASKSYFINEMKENLQFPANSGANLDAVWDCMTDLSWLNAQEIRLVINGWKGTNKKGGFDYQAFLGEVETYWNNNPSLNFVIEYA